MVDSSLHGRIITGNRRKKIIRSCQMHQKDPVFFFFWARNPKVGVKASFCHVFCFFFTCISRASLPNFQDFSRPCLFLFFTGTKVGLHGQNSRISFNWYHRIHDNGTTLGGLMQTNLKFQHIFKGTFGFHGCDFCFHGQNRIFQGNRPLTQKKQWSKTYILMILWLVVISDWICWKLVKSDESWSRT